MSWDRHVLRQACPGAAMSQNRCVPRQACSKIDTSQDRHVPGQACLSGAAGAQGVLLFSRGALGSPHLVYLQPERHVPSVCGLCYLGCENIGSISAPKEMSMEQLLEPMWYRASQSICKAPQMQRG